MLKKLNKIQIWRTISTVIVFFLGFDYETKLPSRTDTITSSSSVSRHFSQYPDIGSSRTQLEVSMPSSEINEVKFGLEAQVANDIELGK